MKIFRSSAFLGMALGIGVAAVCTVLAQTQRAKAQKMTPQKLTIAEDLDRRLARWRAVKMPLDKSGLSAQELRLIDKLVEACHHLENIFWRQSDPDGLELYISLAKSGRDRDLQRLLFINGGRFDLIDENQPFVGTDRMPPGRGFYPKGVTRAEVEEYVRRHPEKKAEIYSPYTMVRRAGAGFAGVPYHTV